MSEKEKNLKESIKVNQAYMIRNDGKVIEVSQHPQILNSDYQSVNDVSNSMLLKCCTETISGINSIAWLYKNTRYTAVKEKIELFINAVRGTFFPPFTALDAEIKDDPIEANEDEIKLSLLAIRKALNQEFLRVRTSGKYGYTTNDKSIYFRVSSIYFNWFNIIWQFVYDNKTFISDVTIVSDEEQLGEEKYYIINGSPMNMINTEEFLNLSGNPEIESFGNKYINELKRGEKSIFEIFNHMNYSSIHFRFSALSESYETLVYN